MSRDKAQRCNTAQHHARRYTKSDKFYIFFTAQDFFVVADGGPSVPGPSTKRELNIRGSGRLPASWGLHLQHGQRQRAAGYERRGEARQVRSAPRLCLRHPL